jgi:hypothetical protein
MAHLRAGVALKPSKAKRRMAIDKVPHFDNKPPLAGGIKSPPSMRCPRLLLEIPASF